MSVRLYISTACFLLREHRMSLVPKILLRFDKKANITRRIKRSYFNDSPVRHLIRLGEFTKALSLFDSGFTLKPKNFLLASDLRNQLLELDMFPPKGRTVRVGDSSKAPRILYLLTNSVPFTKSGYSIRSQKLLLALRENHVSIFGVTRLGYPLIVGKRIKESMHTVDGVTYHALLPDYMPFAAPERHQKSADLLRKIVLEQNVSIIHTTTGFVNAISASRIAKEFNIPWIYEVRGELESTWLSRLPSKELVIGEHSEFYRKSRALENAYAKDADAVIVLSEISKNELIRRGVDRQKIFIVPNSVDEVVIDKTFDKDSLKVKFRLPLDKKLIGTVTSLVKYEGLNVLIDSLLYLPEEYVALIVGEGVMRRELEDQAFRLGLSDRVLFVGEKPESTIEEWYAVLDAFIMPRLDTLVCRRVTPLKALTAQAIGIPVVASDLPAIREVTGNVETYVEPESPEQFAKAILNVQVHSDGRVWASTRTWNKAAGELTQIYDHLLNPDSIDGDEESSCG